ncbi:hypothetical protein D3C76_1782000 [compost metagenome]
MRLTGTKKPADPYARLFVVTAEVAQVGGEDLVHAGLVFTFANEGFQLVAQGVERLLGQIVLNLSYTVVGQIVF